MILNEINGSEELQKLKGFKIATIQDDHFEISNTDCIMIDLEGPNGEKACLAFSMDGAIHQGIIK